ncbi:DUF2310 family Zn-ribbon-containing protein [Larkinella sp. GY13]|uniref:DUF2310 family Zn-ribbon-containing protein n=1 Tax=Larkinella sp. GY13 TaxID=3453720 RepID=UPI003EED0499
MYSVDIVLDMSKTGFDESAYNRSLFLEGLYDSRQICTNSYQFIRNGNQIRIPVTCPEKDSLDDRNATDYAKKWRSALESQLGASIEYVHTGVEAAYEGYEVPENSSFYILYYRGFSPLVCGDTHQEIPLYRIPYTYTALKNYKDISGWQWEYETFYDLWYSIDGYEKRARKEMEDVNSNLSKRGREICQRIEEATGVPTFYYLLNYRDWGRKKDLARKCPITGKDWLIEGSTFNDFIGFKCDESRLVSGLSSSR